MFGYSVQVFFVLGAVVLAVELVLLAHVGLWQDKAFWVLVFSCVLVSFVAYDQFRPPQPRWRGLVEMGVAAGIAGAGFLLTRAL
jgi:hypothetical protein